MGKPPLRSRKRRSMNASRHIQNETWFRQHDAHHWLIDLNERLYAGHKIAALVDTLSDTGVKVTTLLAGSDLTELRLRSASARVSYKQMITVFRNALRLSPDPTFALRAGQRMHVTSYGMYGYALMSSASHEAALEFAAKFHTVMGPVAAMNLALSDTGAMFEYDPILSTDPGDALYRSCVEFVIASHLTLNRDLYGPSFRFSQIDVSYTQPDYADAYRRILGSDVRFGQSNNIVQFDARWLREPVPFSDPITNAQAQELCGQALQWHGNTRGIASRVHRFLVDHPGFFPDVETMAAQLSMTTRMFNRRLQEEDTNYRTIVSDFRMKLAVEYLRKTQMTNEDIAARLGYSDAANFRHAFKRWTGKTPSDYRL